MCSMAKEKFGRGATKRDPERMRLRTLARAAAEEGTPPKVVLVAHLNPNN